MTIINIFDDSPPDILETKIKDVPIEHEEEKKYNVYEYYYTFSVTFHRK